MGSMGTGQGIGGGQASGERGGSGGSGSSPGGDGGDLDGVLRESMEGYDREMARERSAMASSGQGTAADSGGAGGMIGEQGGADGAMVTIPSMSGSGSGGATGGMDRGGSRDGGSQAGGAGGGGGQGTSPGQGQPGDQPDSRVEIPEDIAEVTGREDQVARQIREAAEQEEDPRIRKALWDEYRKHMGLKTK